MSMQEPRELDFAMAISEISVLLQRILTRSKAWSSRNKSRHEGRVGEEALGAECWALWRFASDRSSTATPTKEDSRDNDNPCTQADRAYPQARVDRGRVDFHRPALNHLITVLRNWSGPASRSR